MFSPKKMYSMFCWQVVAHNEFHVASPAHPAKALFVRHKVHDCKLLPRKMDEVVRPLFRPISTNISAAKSMGVQGPKGPRN